MLYGCIGKNIVHSYSPDIHKMIGRYEYELINVDESGFESILNGRKFNGINITMPYKIAVMKHLDFTDETAKRIGAVNTVVNANNKLYGYNTDFYGLISLAKYSEIDFRNKNVLILGTGGTSNTAKEVAEHLGCKGVVKVSRTKGKGNITYNDIRSVCDDTDIVINTTPCGMYPNDHDEPLIDLSLFKNLTGVLDVVYDPLQTPLVLKAREMGLKAENGLFMLVVQAVKAAELFLSENLKENLADRIYERLLNQEKNIVLIGMPASGKTTIGKIVAEITKQKFIDTDEEIESMVGKTVSAIFSEKGEGVFREYESEIIKDISKEHGMIISTGGGVIKNADNIRMLRKNGMIYYIKRDVENLHIDSSRPLCKDKESFEKLYCERNSLYEEYADKTIDAGSLSSDCIAQMIARECIK